MKPSYAPGDTDDYLINAVKRGDEQAFFQLAQRHTAWMIGLARRYCESLADAEDLVQEILLRIWNHPNKFDECRGTKLSAWLYTLVKNASLDYIKSRERRKDKHERWGIYREVLVQAEDNAYGLSAMAISAEEQFNQLNAMIAKLPPDQQVAVELAYLQALPQNKVGELMGKSRKAVESLLSRAKRSLISQIRPE